jgi:hypothetical protein
MKSETAVVKRIQALEAELKTTRITNGEQNFKPGGIQLEVLESLYWVLDRGLTPEEISEIPTSST